MDVWMTGILSLNSPSNMLLRYKTKSQLLEKPVKIFGASNWDETVSTREFRKDANVVVVFKLSTNSHSFSRSSN